MELFWLKGFGSTSIADILSRSVLALSLETSILTLNQLTGLMI